ncbi:predicted protein [Plenodomus lingam JN3]|uniref:Predicted protein n=1 Tax=Leptosphaeria maculans (strain JN3 / isolate v23.1.3 / race Av1-4-5-6-7-8) TaxID=985895 RepID=E5A8V1_LEPMJ|nr:predicted protein [Plenodomus lingam JN3]CBY00046.1 predicted protein [Plenodomus lingam JN3]
MFETEADPERGLQCQLSSDPDATCEQSGYQQSSWKPISLVSLAVSSNTVAMGSFLWCLP